MDVVRSDFQGSVRFLPILTNKCTPCCSGRELLVWEQYFDFYLDGKPAPRPRPTESVEKIRGWTPRSCTATVGEGVLRVRPIGQKRRAFLAVAGLELPAKVTAVVRLRSERGGEVGVAWREMGQKDFVKEQVVLEEVTKGESREKRLAIPASKQVIHIRLLLPAGTTDIESVRFEDATGKALKMWRFDK